MFFTKHLTSMNKTIKTLTGIALSVFLFITAAVPSFAGINVPVTVDIPITYIVKGNDKTAGGDTFTLTADDPEAPMPEGAVDGEKTITIKREGSYSFGKVHYDRPEVWWYTVSRDVTKKRSVTKDDSVFRVKVVALNDGHGYVMVFKDGSDKKCELVYIDKVSPATGDSNMIIYLGTAFIAAAIILLFVLMKKRERKTDKE